MNDFNETNAGNDLAQDTTPALNDNSGEPRVNAGTIRKSTTQSILKAASAAAGMDFDSVETMAAALARLSAQQSMATQQPQSKEASSPKRATNTDLQEQFQSLRQELSQKEQALRERELDSEIRQSMGDRFDQDLVDYALTKVRSNIQWEDGTYQIVNSRGQVRYGDDGTPLTIQGLVDEVARGNPKLLKMAQGSTQGSGLRPQQGMYGGEAESMPDYTADPAAFNAWANRNGLGRGAGLKSVGAKVSTSSTSRRVI